MSELYTRTHICRPNPEKGQHVEQQLAVITMNMYTEEQFCTIPVRYIATLRSKKILLSNVKQEIWQLCVNFC